MEQTSCRRMSALPNSELGVRRDLGVSVQSTRVQLAPGRVQQQNQAFDAASGRQLFVHIRWTDADPDFAPGPATFFQVLEKASRKVLHVGTDAQAVVTSLVPMDELVASFTLLVRAVTRQSSGEVDSCFDEVSHNFVAPAALCPSSMPRLIPPAQESSHVDETRAGRGSERSIDNEDDEDAQSQESDDRELARYRTLAAALEAADQSVMRRLRAALCPDRKQGRMLTWCTNAPGVRVSLAHDLFHFEQIARHHRATKGLHKEIPREAQARPAQTTSIRPRPLPASSCALPRRARRSLAEIYIAAAMRKVALSDAALEESRRDPGPVACKTSAGFAVKKPAAAQQRAQPSPRAMRSFASPSAGGDTGDLTPGR